MTNALSTQLLGRSLELNLMWQPLLAVAQATFLPNRWLGLAWLFATSLFIVGILSKAGWPLIFGGFTLLGLHLSIPVQINNLSRKKSWLLLPGFKPLVLTLLLLLLTLWLAVVALLQLKAPSAHWVALPYTALVFSLVMLPTIYVRHLWPLLAELVLCITAFSHADSKSWPALAQLFTTPWFIGAVIAATILLWLLMARYWLHPAQRASSEVTRTSVFALYGIEIPWLQRITRSAASLEGTLLLGDGDSWLASLVRAFWATWLGPAIFWLIGLLLHDSNQPQSRLWTEQTFLVLLTLTPLFTLSAQQQKSTQRLARCWLFTNGCRQTMYGFAERKFYQELAAYLMMTLILMLLLVPLPIILPLLCYGTSATLLLCYLIFTLAGRTFWWSISANLLLLTVLLVAVDFLWKDPGLMYLTSLALVLPIYSLRRYGKAFWLKLDYAQLKPRQLL